MKQLSKSCICGLLGVSRQKYYRNIWHIEKCKEKVSSAIALTESIRIEMPRIGTRKLYYLLHNELHAIGVGRDKYFEILRANRMLVKPYRSYRITTNSHHRFHKHKNLIADMNIVRPEQVWVADITYIGSRNNNQYLALITDAYSKKIVGYDLSNSLDTKGTLRALSMANKGRRYPNMHLIHHSDRGIQYCSDAYQKQMMRYKITPSMTESYDPYANAIAERVNGILKQEFMLEGYTLPLNDMKKVIKETIEIYNNHRPHYSCNYKTPSQMHLLRDVKIKTYKKQINTMRVPSLC